MEVAIEQVARELVVEADRVVARAAGAGRAERVGDDLRERGLVDAVRVGVLRRDAGQQDRVGVRQHVGRQAPVRDDRLLDRLERRVGADAGELRDAIAPRVGAERLVVVPEEGRSGDRHRLSA